MAKKAVVFSHKDERVVALCFEIHRVLRELGVDLSSVRIEPIAERFVAKIASFTSERRTMRDQAAMSVFAYHRERERGSAGNDRECLERAARAAANDADVLLRILAETAE